MKRSTFIKVAAALGVVGGLCLPASAQVSNNLLNQAFGSGTTQTSTSGSAPNTTSTINSTPAQSAFSALKTGGTTNQSLGANETILSVTSGATGGKTGTVTFSGAEGDSQRFAVGTATSFGVNASASSTSDYSVTSSANLGLGTAGTASTPSTFKQSIGTANLTENTTNLYAKPTAENLNQNGVISGTFTANSTTNPTTGADSATNNVEVAGVGNLANVNASSTSEFKASIAAKNTSTPSNSATATGGASGNISSTASADASRTSFSSIFLQSF